MPVLQVVHVSTARTSRNTSTARTERTARTARTVLHVVAVVAVQLAVRGRPPFLMNGQPTAGRWPFNWPATNVAGGSPSDDT